LNAVVDTNVIAYFLLGTEPFTAETRRFFESAVGLVAPSLWEAEIANVIWMAVRGNVLAPPDAAARLKLAARLGVHSVPSRRLWHGAVAHALQSGVAVYDTLFVELALREKLPLATFDRKVLQAFPGVAQRPGALS